MRLALLLALLLAPLACAQSDTATDVLDDAAVTPAAPPASNAEAVVEAAPPAADAAPTDPETAAAFQRILADAARAGIAELPYGEIVQWVGEQLVGVPYVAGMLDAPERETLVVSLTGFDCVLYIENVLALSRMVALGQTGYADYAAGVRALRYRGASEPSYCARLHYFTDWIRDNQARGTLRDVTREAGGEPLDKTLDFMSTHRDSYRQLASDDAYACVQGMEASLRDLNLVYIPQDRIAGAYAMIQPGDIIATATSIGGLDVTHTGFAHVTTPRGGPRVGFMHASLSSNAVKVSPDLQAYVQGVKSQVGVIVARPLDPRR